MTLTVRLKFTCFGASYAVTKFFFTKKATRESMRSLLQVHGCGAGLGTHIQAQQLELQTINGMLLIPDGFWGSFTPTPIYQIWILSDISQDLQASQTTEVFNPHASNQLRFTAVCFFTKLLATEKVFAKQCAPMHKFWWENRTQLHDKHWKVNLYDFQSDHTLTTPFAKSLKLTSCRFKEQSPNVKDCLLFGWFDSMTAQLSILKWNHISSCNCSAVWFLEFKETHQSQRQDTFGSREKVSCEKIIKYALIVRTLLCSQGFPQYIQLQKVCTLQICGKRREE